MRTEAVLKITTLCWCSMCGMSQQLILETRPAWVTFRSSAWALSAPPHILYILSQCAHLIIPELITEIDDFNLIGRHLHLAAITLALQWNPSNPNTHGTIPSVLLSEVSFQRVSSLQT